MVPDGVSIENPAFDVIQPKVRCHHYERGIAANLTRVLQRLVRRGQVEV